ncbi:hypothetical protein PGIGA_G00248130 [Pangasianodon gigas]|uniref:Uncharacterized protein n=1 Tax=Pangasianodon gigas TaxID=30993 RepID=A0ACC5WQ58_PANGG|nr:hypothetical protein [Pangasianodon gigas]
MAELIPPRVLQDDPAIKSATDIALHLVHYTKFHLAIIVTCEGGTAVLNCGNRRIRIISVFYGRIDSATCAAGRPRKEIANTSCSSSKAQSEVSARCNRRNSCQVPATNYVFPDPCYGTYKYLKIAYDCR